MIIRKSAQAFIFALGLILVVYLLGSAINLTRHRPLNQQSRPVPLPGIQVTVVNKSNPRAKPMSVTTDADGAFDLGVLPAGTYALTLEMTDAASKAARAQVPEKVGGIDSASASAARVTVEGTSEGAVVRGWDFKEKKAIRQTNDPSTIKQNPNARLNTRIDTVETDISFTADGKQKVKGAIHNMSLAKIQKMRDN